jgi:hypothetical protein
MALSLGRPAARARQQAVSAVKCDAEIERAEKYLSCHLKAAWMLAWQRVPTRRPMWLFTRAILYLSLLKTQAANF